MHPSPRYVDEFTTAIGCQIASVFCCRYSREGALAGDSPPSPFNPRDVVQLSLDPWFVDIEVSVPTICGRNMRISPRYVVAMCEYSHDLWPQYANTLTICGRYLRLSPPYRSICVISHDVLADRSIQALLTDAINHVKGRPIRGEPIRSRLVGPLYSGKGRVWASEIWRVHRVHNREIRETTYTLNPKTRNPMRLSIRV